MFLSNRGSFRPETSGAYTLRRRGRRRPKSGSAIGACAVARLAGSGGPIGDYYGSANKNVERDDKGEPTGRTFLRIRNADEADGEFEGREDDEDEPEEPGEASGDDDDFDLDEFIG